MKVIWRVFETVAVFGTIVMLSILTVNLIAQVSRLDVPTHSVTAALVVFLVAVLYWTYRLLEFLFRREKPK